MNNPLFAHTPYLSYGTYHREYLRSGIIRAVPEPTKSGRAVMLEVVPELSVQTSRLLAAEVWGYVADEMIRNYPSSELWITGQGDDHERYTRTLCQVMQERTARYVPKYIADKAMGTFDPGFAISVSPDILWRFDLNHLVPLSRSLVIARVTRPIIDDEAALLRLIRTPVLESLSDLVVECCFVHHFGDVIGHGARVGVATWVFD